MTQVGARADRHRIASHAGSLCCGSQTLEVVHLDKIFGMIQFEFSSLRPRKKDVPSTQCARLLNARPKHLCMHAKFVVSTALALG
jgi:hypothetical protein